jgi:hypothetical protein
VLAIKRGDVTSGLGLLEAGFELVGEARSAIGFLIF